MICCGRACMHRRPSFYGYISAGSEIQTSREPQIYFVFDLWAGPTRRKSGGLIITDFAGFFFFFFWLQAREEDEMLRVCLFACFSTVPADIATTAHWMCHLFLDSLLVHYHTWCCDLLCFYWSSEFTKLCSVVMASTLFVTSRASWLSCGKQSSGVAIILFICFV